MYKIPKCGTMINGVISACDQIAPYQKRNTGSDSGLLPTPTASQGGYNRSPGSNKIRPSLETMARLGTLQGALEMLPTPTCRDSGLPLPQRKKHNGGGQKPPLVSVIGSKLNPAFVECLMGYERGWTSI